MKQQAKWVEVGKLIYKLTKIVYMVPFDHTCGWTEHLGAMKLRHDGRWDWWRLQSKFHKWATGQGVADDEEAAKARVLEGWE